MVGRTTNLPDGIHPITTATVDTAGNKSTVSGSLPLRIDTTPPTGVLTNPTSGSTVNGSVNLTAAASDAVGVWKVVFQVDGIATATVTTAPYSYVWNSASVANGAHTVAAVTTDNAGNAVTSSASVTVANGVAATVPGAPSLGSAVGGNGSVTLSWSAPVSNGGSAITGYRIYRSTVSGGEVLLVSVGVSGSYVDSGLVNGTTYYYQVSAVNSLGEGGRSLERSGVPVAVLTVPGAPTITGATGGDRQVSLSWGAPVSNGGSAITGYRIYRSTVSGGEVLLVSVGVSGSYVDSGLVNGTTYYYQVSAVNSLGEGGRSLERSGVPVAVLTVPGAPTITGATGGDRQVSLSWGAPVSNGGSAITGYRIYRSTVSGGEVLLVSVGVSGSYVDSGLVNGTTYYYQVSAVNSLGEGGRSSERSGVPVAVLTVPGAPTITGATGGDRQVSLSWGAPVSNGGSAITGYRIYRSTVSGGEVLLVSVGVSGSYVDSGLVNGTTYYYQVSAVNSLGEGGRSSERSAAPVAQLIVTIPSAPTITLATGGDHQVSLTWSAPGSNGGSAVTGYRIYRSTASGSETLLTTVGATGYVDATTHNNTTYYYKVTAINAIGESAFSNERSATPRKHP